MKKPAQIKPLDTEGLTLDYNKFANELSTAEYALGLLEGSQKKLQNPDLLISPLTAKEAVMSSKIEGTQSDVADVFMFDAGEQTKHADIREVVNYRRAMSLAMREIGKSRDVTSHLIESLHSVLLEDVRHKGLLGKFREGQVWIAERAGDSIEKAIYIPPEPIHVRGLINNLFDYINNGKENALLKAGITHYQFEAVHPFDDGNGRIGRLLIPLVLHKQQRLSSPILYLSGYFEDHRDEYIDKLHAIDEGNDIEEWLKFFLQSVSGQLNETQKIIEAIYELYYDIRRAYNGVKSPYIIPFIDMLFISPIFTIKMVQEHTKCASYLTATNLIRSLEKKGYVFEIGNRSRNKLFRFDPLLTILH
ncbi:MAG: Fic/DOC family N-terminal domain-containing protein [Patescibacteria group bacterium]